MSQVGVTESGEIERPSLLSVLYVGEDDGAMAELEAVLGQLERGDVALDESIALYERGAKLKGRVIRQ